MNSSSNYFDADLDAPCYSLSNPLLKFEAPDKLEEMDWEPISNFDNGPTEQKPPYSVLSDLGLFDLGPIDRLKFNDVYQSPEFAASSEQIINDLFALSSNETNLKHNYKDCTEVVESFPESSGLLKVHLVMNISWRLALQQPLVQQPSDLGPINDDIQIKQHLSNSPKNK